MLREVLPVSPGVSSDGRDVCVSGSTCIVTQSHRFEQELAAAARLPGNERLAATLNAVAPAIQGEYRPGLSSAWVDARREQLAALIVNAQFEAAQLALASGRYEEAEQLISRVLTATRCENGDGVWPCVSPRRWAMTTRCFAPSNAASGRLRPSARRLPRLRRGCSTSYGANGGASSDVA
jgi:hypothetical protein